MCGWDRLATRAGPAGGAGRPARAGPADGAATRDGSAGGAVPDARARPAGSPAACDGSEARSSPAARIGPSVRIGRIEPPTCRNVRQSCGFAAHLAGRPRVVEARQSRLWRAVPRHEGDLRRCGQRASDRIPERERLRFQGGPEIGCSRSRFRCARPSARWPIGALCVHPGGLLRGLGRPCFCPRCGPCKHAGGIFGGRSRPASGHAAFGKSPDLTR